MVGVLYSPSPDCPKREGGADCRCPISYSQPLTVDAQFLTVSPSLMILFPFHDGESTINLFKENEAAHLMGQGKSGKRQDFFGAL